MTPDRHRRDVRRRREPRSSSARRSPAAATRCSWSARCCPHNATRDGHDRRLRAQPARGSAPTGSTSTSCTGAARVPLAETVAGVRRRCSAAGKIRHWGVSNFDVGDMKELLAVCRAATPCADRPGALQPRAPRHRVGPAAVAARARGMPVMAYSPIEQGRLPAIRRSRGDRRRATGDAGAVALAWVLRPPRRHRDPEGRRRPSTCARTAGALQHRPDARTTSLELDARLPAAARAALSARRPLAPALSSSGRAGLASARPAAGARSRAATSPAGPGGRGACARRSGRRRVSPDTSRRYQRTPRTPRTVMARVTVRSRSRSRASAPRRRPPLGQQRAVLGGREQPGRRDELRLDGRRPRSSAAARAPGSPCTQIARRVERSRR